MSAQDLLLKAALMGRLEDEVASAEAWLAACVTQASDEASENVLTKMREDIAQSRLRGAARLRTTWRKKRYPASGDSLSPASWIYSKMPAVVIAFEDGATISSDSGRWLTIPNPAVWPVRSKRRKGRTSMLDIAVARFGPLRFVYRPGNRVALLVAEVRASQKHAGKFRKASARALKTGRDLATIVVFFLVREARVPRLLKGATIRKRAERDFPADVQRRLPQIFNSKPRPRVIAGRSR